MRTSLEVDWQPETARYGEDMHAIVACGSVCTSACACA